MKGLRFYLVLNGNFPFRPYFSHSTHKKIISRKKKNPTYLPCFIFSCNFEEGHKQMREQTTKVVIGGEKGK